MNPLFILSCDGGGIRGLMTALLIQSLDRQYGILSKANMFAGTSTGGIIALALASGVPISQVVNLYETQGANIFQTLDIQFDCLLPEDREAAAAAGLPDPLEFFQAKYDNTGLQSVIQQVLPSYANTLQSLTPNVLVNTFQLNNAAPDNACPQIAQWMPVTLDNLAGSATSQTTILDACMCTSAAPLYFPPYQHPDLGYCSDGGIFANNPSTAAIARALSAGAQLGQITMLSMGTGLTPNALQVSNPKCMGINTWLWPFASGPAPAFPLLNALMDGVSSLTDFECAQILGARYIRADVCLPQAVDLDDYESIGVLETAVQQYMQTPAWTAVQTWVQNNFSSSGS